MPELTARKAEPKSKTRKLMERDPKQVLLAKLKGDEQIAMAKLERIKTWSPELREEATARTEDNLSQIRERMSALEPSK